METGAIQDRDVFELIKKYNVLFKAQVYAYFGQEQAVSRALKRLLKDHRIGYNKITRMVYVNENSYADREEGTLIAFWALIDLKQKKQISEHFLADKEEFPIRIIFVSEGELFDILYVGVNDVKLVNSVFERKIRTDCWHIVVVSDFEVIEELELPAMGYCLLKGDGKIEYYTKS